MLDRMQNSKPARQSQSPSSRLSQDSCQGAGTTVQGTTAGQTTPVLTKELGGVRVGGLLIISESFVDDLPDGSVEALQLFVLGGHTRGA